MANTPTDAAVTKEINGSTYGTRHMDPEKVLQHAGKVFNLSGIAALASKDPDIMQVIKDCLALAMVNNRELGRDDYWKVHFIGKQKDLILVIAWLLEVHFADFFGELPSVAESFKKRFGALLG